MTISSKRIVLGVDIGTTNLKVFAYDNSIKLVGKSIEKLPVLNINNNGQEVVPKKLWEVFKSSVKKCLHSGNLNVEDIASLGISTQRGTFLTWNKKNGDIFHNFITWKDKRAQKLCEMWNSAISIKFLRIGAFILYLLTLMKKFQLLSSLQFSASMVLIRLYWIFQNIDELQDKKNHKDVLFGTIETWLVWKLTGGKVHATDASNACATGFFDPFQMQWAKWLLKMFGIPATILPVVKNTCDSFGETLPNIFGAPIPIHAVVGDQQSSLFGAGCFEKYDITCTMGTGSFLNMNTGSTPYGAYDGFYPLVGWCISSKPTYIIEGGVHDVGTIISWMRKLGLIDDPERLDNIALSIPDNGNVYFLPGSSTCKGENISTSSFIGLLTNTSKEQMVRSVLEASAFQVCELYNIIQKMYDMKEKSLFCVCGGVAKNDFILQLISNIVKRNINRLDNTESSGLGAALLAGLYSGFWKSQEEIKSLINYDRTYTPNVDFMIRNNREFTTWRNAYSSSIIKKQV